MAACGVFSCGMWDLDSWPGIEPGPPELGTRSLSHWTTREDPPPNHRPFNVCPKAVLWPLYHAIPFWIINTHPETMISTNLNYHQAEALAFTLHFPFMPSWDLPENPLGLFKN